MRSPQNTATLFIDRNSWLQWLHPFTKLTYILLTGVVVYAGPAGWGWFGLLFLLNAVVLASAGLFAAAARMLGRIMLPLMLFMLPIHGLLYPGNATSLFTVFGFSCYLEGLLFALTILARLTLVLMASLLFVYSTHPADLITAISQGGGSPSLAYLLGSPLLLLAAMRERVDVIQAAQSARGLPLDGNVFKRFRTLAPLLLPLVIGAIVEVEQRAVALEVRGFKSRSAKTYLHRMSDSIPQRSARWLMLVACVAIMLYRVSW